MLNKLKLVPEIPNWLQVRGLALPLACRLLFGRRHRNACRVQPASCNCDWWFTSWMDLNAPLLQQRHEFLAYTRATIQDHMLSGMGYAGHRCESHTQCWFQRYTHSERHASTCEGISPSLVFIAANGAVSLLGVQPPLSDIPSSYWKNEGISSYPYCTRVCCLSGHNCRRDTCAALKKRGRHDHASVSVSPQIRGSEARGACIRGLTGRHE